MNAITTLAKLSVVGAKVACDAGDWRVPVIEFLTDILSTKNAELEVDARIDRLGGLVDQLQKIIREIKGDHPLPTPDRSPTVEIVYSSLLLGEALPKIVELDPPKLREFIRGKMLKLAVPVSSRNGNNAGINLLPVTIVAMSNGLVVPLRDVLPTACRTLELATIKFDRGVFELALNGAPYWGEIWSGRKGKRLPKLTAPFNRGASITLSSVREHRLGLTRNAAKDDDHIFEYCIDVVRSPGINVAALTNIRARSMKCVRMCFGTCVADGVAGAFDIDELLAQIWFVENPVK